MPVGAIFVRLVRIRSKDVPYVEHSTESGGLVNPHGRSRSDQTLGKLELPVIGRQQNCRHSVVQLSVYRTRFLCDGSVNSIGVRFADCIEKCSLSRRLLIHTGMVAEKSSARYGSAAARDEKMGRAPHFAAL